MPLQYTPHATPASAQQYHPDNNVNKNSGVKSTSEPGSHSQLGKNQESTGQLNIPTGLSEPQMHSSRRLRYRQVVDDIVETLIGIAIDPRLMPAPAAIASSASGSDLARTVRSSASTPSLRSRDGTVPMHARMDPGGNVRVVVRVRAFLPRGKSDRHQTCLVVIHLAGRQRLTVSMMRQR